jgi:hypothetical protein
MRPRRRDGSSSGGEDEYFRRDFNFSSRLRSGREEIDMPKTGNDQKIIYCPDCGHCNISKRKSCEKCESALPKKKVYDLTSLITLAAFIVSILALLPAALQAYDSHQALAVGQAGLRPLVEVLYSSYDDKKSLDLINKGKGPAVITKIQFYKNGEPFFPLENITFDNFIDSGKSIHLSDTSWEKFIDVGITNMTQLEELTKAWTDSFNGTILEVEYEDTLGNKQEPYYTFFTM